MNRVKPELPVELKNEQPISYEEASEMIGDSIALKILSKNFRERIDGFASLKTLIESNTVSAKTTFSFLTKTGFKDSNPIVTSMMYDALASCCAWTSEFSLSFADLVFPQCLISLADSKATKSINNFLFELAECISAETLSTLVLQHLQAIKSPKSIQCSLAFLVELLNKFGSKEFPIISVIDSVKRFLSFAQGNVRQAAIDFFVELSSQTGLKYEERILDALNSTLASTLKSKLKENADPSYSSSKKNRIYVQHNDSPKTQAKMKKGSSVDIAKEISSAISKLGDSNWKVRKDALESIEKTFRMSGGECELRPDIQGNLFQAAAARLKDSNKNIIGLALKVSLKIAENIVNPNRLKVVPLIDALIQTVGDSKKTISQGAEDALLEWVVKAECCYLIFCHKFENAAKVAGAKASLLSILKAGYLAHSRFDFDSLLASVLHLLNDKNKDARNCADSLIDSLQPLLSLDQVNSAIRSFVPQEQIVIRRIMEKKCLKSIK
jgi:hypothetical protein